MRYLLLNSKNQTIHPLSEMRINANVYKYTGLNFEIELKPVPSVTNL
jgi:hypothetical protein